MPSIAIQISGMRCMSCAGKVERIAATIAGVRLAQVDLMGQRLVLQLADDADFPVLATELDAALAAGGYTAQWLAHTYAVGHLSCAGCARKVEQQARRIAGVYTATVDVLGKRLNVQVANAEVLEQLESAEASIGYPLQLLGDVAVEPASPDASCDLAEPSAAAPASLLANAAAASAMTGQSAVATAAQPTATAPLTSSLSASQRSATDQPAAAPAAVKPHVARDYPLWHVVAAFVLALPLLAPMLWSFVSPAPMEHWMLPPLWQLLLAAPVQFYLGARFYRGAFYALKSGTGSMDLLVAIGTSAAFGLSVYNGWFANVSAMPALYFESASVVIAFVLLGKYLEEGVKQQTQSALSALAELQPQQVRVWRDGAWQWLALSQVALGDRVQVKPGERIALDGLVLAGESQVDEALISGESQPLHKTQGDLLVSGALNIDGVLEFLVQKRARESRLQQLISQVEQAQLSKAPLQQRVDRISSYFVPAVLVIALLTCVLTYVTTVQLEPAILHAVAVLVIACPCALGLATPAALVVGIGRAASFGILLKDAATLDALSRIDTVFFDKTGTVTLGTPTLARSHVLLDIAEGTALQWAASLQQHSEHPQAQAFLQANTLPLLAVQNYQVLPGLGVQATLPELAASHSFAMLPDAAPAQPVYLALGSVRLAQRLQLDVPAELRDASSLLLQLLVPVDSAAQIPAAAGHARLLAAFWLDDALRPSAMPAVAALRQLGVQSVLLSGDLTSRVQSAAAQLGVSQWFAEQQPEQKLQQIEQAQQRGQHVAMVGDGINDAPALAKAEVGIALTTGTQVAAASSQVSLLHGDLALLVAAVEVSRRTRRVIWQNLGWAFGFNLLAIPAAALGYLTPALAGAAMAMSSVLVVSNALRLRRWSPTPLAKLRANTPQVVRDLFH